MRNHLTYYGWIYFVYTLLVFAVVLTVFRQLSLPQPHERIVVFFAGTGIDPDGFESDLLNGLDRADDTPIEDVELQYIDDSAVGFEEILATKSIGDTDLCILPMSAIKSNTGEIYFMPLSAQILRDAFGEGIELYVEVGIVFGLVLNPEGVENRFTSYLAEDDAETYVLFINAHSVNVGSWNDFGDDDDVHAIETIRWFLEAGND